MSPSAIEALTLVACNCVSGSSVGGLSERWYCCCVSASNGHVGGRTALLPTTCRANVVLTVVRREHLMGALPATRLFRAVGDMHRR